MLINQKKKRKKYSMNVYLTANNSLHLHTKIVFVWGSVRKTCSLSIIVAIIIVVFFYQLQILLLTLFNYYLNKQNRKPSSKIKVYSAESWNE